MLKQNISIIIEIILDHPLDVSIIREYSKLKAKLRFI